jgi:putative heme-binding domain-containing protein
VPEDLRKSVDFRRWNNRGRLWRISRKDAKLAIGPPLGKAPTAGLVAALDGPNAWRRDAAQRLIVERRDASAVPGLVALARSGASPLGRAHALWTLDGLGSLDDSAIAGALSDPSAEVREAAAKLADGRPGLAEVVVKAADDPAIRVRFQAAIALGDLADDRAAPALARIAARDADDEWSRLAVLSGLGEKADRFLNALLDAHPEWLDETTSGRARLLASTASILGARNRPDELRGLANRLTPDPEAASVAGRIALLDGLSDGLARAGRPLHALLQGKPAEGFEGVAALLDRAAKVVPSADASPADRAQALGLLARCRPEACAKAVPDLLASDQPDVLQSAAARAVAEVGSPELAGNVLERWGSIPTRVRREVLSALTTSAPLADRLATAIEDEDVAPAELAPADREALRLTPDAALRARIEKLLSKSAPVDRSAVVRAFQPSLDLKGDARRGGELFAKNCQTCHQRQGQGHRVGPDLSGVAGRPPAALLKDILDPNADVSPDFGTFLVVTRRGQTFSGLLAEETASSLKLRAAEGVEQSILRSEIEALRPSGRTLMPEGLEETLGPQGLADLIAFLKQP